MSATIGGAFQKGMAIKELVKRLNGAPEAGRALAIEVDDRSRPYLDHTLAGWTDGPPTSTVAWVLSAADADGHHWRRFTFSKVGPWRYQLACFPTPFNNPADALAPGVPPSSSKAGKHL